VEFNSDFSIGAEPMKVTRKNSGSVVAVKSEAPVNVKKSAGNLKKLVKVTTKSAKVKAEEPATKVKALFKTPPELTTGNLLENLKAQGSLKVHAVEVPLSAQFLGELTITPRFSAQVKGRTVIFCDVTAADSSVHAGNGWHYPVNGALGNRGAGRHVMQEGSIPKELRRGYAASSGVGFFYDARLGYIRVARFNPGTDFEVPVTKARAVKKVKAAKK